MIDYSISRELDDGLRPWVSRATSLVDRRLRDAHNAADRRHWADASERLEEIHAGLVGTDDEPGIVRRAREKFYRDAWGQQRRMLGPGVADPSVGPNAEDAKVAQVVPIQGVNQQLLIRASLNDASDALRHAMAAREMDFDRSPAPLEQWERSQRDRLTSEVRSHLSDAQMALYYGVGQLLLPAAIR